MSQVIEINSTPADSEGELAVLLRMGDESAFKAIYKLYAADLFRFCRRNIYSKEDCEEIIQEIFTSLWERHKAQHILSLRHYLFAAARYKIIRYVRHRKVKLKYEEHYRLFEVMYEVGGEDEGASQSLQLRISKTLVALPARCQAAIKLRLFENLSNGEIAKRMNITKKTVEVYMNKAYNHVRSCHDEIYGTG